MSVAPDLHLLQYRLIERIGAGAMGEVWRAVDTTLDRDVAIKVLPDEVANNPDRIARFEREARTLAALHHPNVAAIYGAHDVDGVRFLAMEYVAGEDLADRLRRGPIPVDEALEIAGRIARGLAAAHERGIVHRDLKPANVKLAPDGAVKVLDFGLARALETPGDSSSSGRTESPTVTSDRTVPGVVLGTAAYMSPEQARGRQVDRRTDLWAFGCVLYESLAGRRPFDGETVTDVLAAVLRAEPDLGALPDGLAPRVRRLIRRCLAKDPDARWRDAGDAALEIEDAGADVLAPSGAGPAAGGTGRLLVAAAVGALGVAALLGATGLLGRGEAAASAPRVIESDVSFGDGFRPVEIRIAPDGSVIAGLAIDLATGNQRLVLRRLDEAEPRRVEGDLLFDHAAFSPDSAQVAFVLVNAPGLARAALMRMPADASAPPVVVTPWEGDWAMTFVWLDDRRLAVADWRTSSLRLIPTDGSAPPAPVPVAYADGGSAALNLHAVVSSTRLLATVHAWDNGYHQDVVLVDLDSGLVTPLVDRAFLPTFLAPDRLLYARGDRLHLVGFDPVRGAVLGDERVVRSGLRVHVEATVADYALSARGDLAYLDGGVVGDRRRIMRIRPGGEAAPLIDAPGSFATGQLDDSQDGSVIAVVVVAPSGLYEVWGAAVDDPLLRPVLRLDGMDCENGTVSPDGSSVVAICTGDPTFQRDGVWLAPFPPDGSAPVQVVRAPRELGVLRIADWLPDGRRVLVRRDVGSAMAAEIVDVSAGLEAEPTPIPSLAGTDVAMIGVSPDGRLAGWIARAPSGAAELRVAPWRGDDVGPYRPLAPASDSGFDWVGRDADGWLLAYVRPDGAFDRLVLESDGRVRRRAGFEIANRIRDVSIAVAFLADGGVVYVERDPAESRNDRVHLVTDWLSRID